MNGDLPATKADLEALSQKLDHAIKELRIFVLDRESALIWKGVIAGAQWAVIVFMLQHPRP